MTTTETKILHERWRGARGRMVPEWRDDFEAYKRWCIEHGWTPEIMVRKVANGRGLLGPDTARIVYMRPGKDRPVRHARMVDDGGFFFRCSECDGLFPFGGNFCPNCGAKMDGDRDA